MSRMACDYLARYSVTFRALLFNCRKCIKKRRSAMTEGMTNVIMRCKYWLGFGDFCQQDLGQLIETRAEEDVKY